MRKIFVIGIGAGDPEFLTGQAIAAMRATDVFFMPDKGAERGGLNRVRLEFLKRFVPEGGYRLVDFTIPSRRKADTPDYQESVADWRGELEAAYTTLFADEIGDGEVGAFLVWGDPALYDGTLGILGDMQARGLVSDFEVIPGISAVQALAARHKVALNGVGEPVVVTTGRRVLGGEADGIQRFVVMLDNEMAFRRFAGQRMKIYWGAYLGTADEILIAGSLSKVLGEIVQARTDAKKRFGWIMDTYLMVRET
ncbi:MAG: precorrin-6A synthase (deacetylating) [Devosia sp.]